MFVKKRLYLIPMLFILIAVFRAGYMYDEIQERELPSFKVKLEKQVFEHAKGEIRDYITVELPKEQLRDHFYRDFIHSVLYDLFLLLLLLILVYVLKQKSIETDKTLESVIAKKSEELQAMLTMHPLTKLPNRNRLLNTLEESGGPGHLALLNIDSFKEINDFYGHVIADRLLVVLAEAMQNRCGDEMSLFKMPADEYAIFTDRPIAHSDFVKNMKSLSQYLSTEKFVFEDIEIDVTFGCGVAFGKESLLIKADVALQKAKKDKRELVVYSEAIDIADKTDRNLQGIAILKKAIEDDRIVPYYQPIYNLHTDEIEKYETLARVVEPDGKVLSPYMFLEVAERSKLYPNITKAMIEKSFSLFATNRYEFSINLSIRDIEDAKTVNYIREQLAGFQGRERLIFEILEGDKIENYSALKQFIEMVKAYGVRIAIDDFGSGYSNFSHIMELDVDYLKIDASLIKGIVTSVNSQIIVQGLIDFSKRLGMKTIGEYVESKAIMDMLRSMDVDYVQGYYIGKPSASLQVIDNDT